jgi:glycosyltransferase involved in cell wall biosynthesis
MKVGLYSPFPPARSGVADYSAALLAAMRPGGAIEPNPASCDIAIYQLGNNQLHAEIYQRALRHPGIAVVHDAVLQHFFLGSLDEDRYVAGFVYNYGVWTEDLARQLWQTRARSATDPRFFRYPMLKRIAEASRAVIVHNPAAAAIVRTHAPGADVREIPHLFGGARTPPAYEVERLRAKLGIGAKTLFGVFGHLRESKRLLPVLRAFHRARLSAEMEMELLIAGEFASSDLARAAGPLMNAEGIRRIGYLAESDFWLYASAIDACINLRYPPAGETSGIAIRLMGLGKPVLMTRGCEVSRFPPDACLQVDAGPAEEDMLTDLMLWLAQSPKDARAIGMRAAAYIGEHHDIDKVARMYWEVVANCYDNE